MAWLNYGQLLFSFFLWYYYLLNSSVRTHFCWFVYFKFPDIFTSKQRPSWSWSYGSWIYNYLWHQCLSPLTLWVRILLMGRCIRFNIMRYNLWHVGGFLRVLWFPPPIKLTTEIVEILLKMTLNIIASISWRSVLLVEEIGVLGENHRPVASHWQTLSHSVVSSTHRQARGSNSQSLELRIRQSWNDNNKRAGYIPWFYLLS